MADLLDAKDEYILAYVLGNLPEGLRFIAWPLHMTIMPWFVIHPHYEKEAMHILAEVIAKHDPINLSVGGDALYGPARSVPVKEVINNRELQNLHQTILDIINQFGWEIAVKRYAGKGYHPHITNRRKWITVPKEIHVDRIHFVKAPIGEDPQKRTRQVVGILPLGGVNA